MVQYDYVCLAPGFAREAVESYDSWKGRDEVPMKIKELMMVLRIEVSKRYGPPWPPAKQELPTYEDLKLGQSGTIKNP